MQLKNAGMAGTLAVAVVKGLSEAAFREAFGTEDDVRGFGGGGDRNSHEAGGKRRKEQPAHIRESAQRRGHR